MSLSRLSSPEGWPLPERHMDVAGRTLPVDLLVVAALNALGTLALLVTLWEGLAEIPSLIGGLFSSEAFVYSFSYLLLLVLVVLLFVCLTPLATAYFLLRADPVGRDLQAFMLAVILLTAFSLAGIPGLYWVVLLVAAATVAVLYLSPWARKALTASARARAVPGPVVLARFLSVAMLALTSLGVVMALPGLRFLDMLGASFVIAMLFNAAGAVLGWRGYNELTRTGPSVTGRAQLTAAIGLILIGGLITTVANSQPFTTMLPTLLLLGTIVTLLWGPASVRAWFARPAAAGAAVPPAAAAPASPPPASTN